MKTKKKKKYIIWGIIAAVFAVFCVAAFWQRLTVRIYTETTDKVSSSIRIVVLTDLHDSTYGKEQKTLIEEIQKQSPDLILLVGDIADDERAHNATEQLLSIIGAEYSCYYVTGNHEYWSGEIDTIKDMIRSYGVTILEGDTEIVHVGSQRIRLCGVDDPDGFRSTYPTDHGTAESWQEQFNACKTETGDGIYSILMSHRPELEKKYQNSGFDLAVAGHAHGGQFRIPGILNGFYAPNQGFFPKYAGGRYELGDTIMIVSRGLSKSRLPRIFNPPELVVVNLEPIK
jgi:predicted MPP superfamily phosphohydrolase